MGTPTEASPATTSLASPDNTTRSGSSATMASRFGSKPERSVVGASAGKSEYSSTATTWLPAPMAKSISVAEGESDTIDSGRDSMVVSTPPAVTVTGNAAAASSPAVVDVVSGVVPSPDDGTVVSSPPHAAATRTSAASSASRRVAWGMRTFGYLLSSRTAARATGDLPAEPTPTSRVVWFVRRGARPDSLAGDRRASPLRDSAGFTPDFVSPPRCRHRSPPAAASSFLATRRGRWRRRCAEKHREDTGSGGVGRLR